MAFHQKVGNCFQISRISSPFHTFLLPLRVRIINKWIFSLCTVIHVLFDQMASRGFDIIQHSSCLVRISRIYTISCENRHLMRFSSGDWPWNARTSLFVLGLMIWNAPKTGPFRVSTIMDRPCKHKVLFILFLVRRVWLVYLANSRRINPARVCHKTRLCEFGLCEDGIT